MSGTVFHRVQDGYADGWPRAVFIDSEGEPTGMRCQTHEAAAIAEGATAYSVGDPIEALRALVKS